MEGTPPHVDLAELERALLQVSGVNQVHDLHVWTLTWTGAGRPRASTRRYVSLITDMKRAGVQLQAKLFRGFADISRLRVLEALRGGPLSAGEVVTRTGLNQPNASMHLACLAECGLVTWERRGRFVHYELAAKRVGKLLDQAGALLSEIGPLIEACPRYRRPPRTGSARRPRERQC